MRFNSLTLQIFKINSNPEECGFTLIELLIVIIVISILVATALGPFLAQATRAKQTEAETNLGSLNRAQQAFRLENPTFATFAELGTSGSISISGGDYYNYVDGAVPTAIVASINAVAQTAPKNYSDDIRNYQAAVNQDSITRSFKSIICRSSSPISDDAVASANADHCIGGTKVGSK